MEAPARRVLIAPQEFKESLTATEAASAIARGMVAARPSWQLDLLPFSDGGPGFLDAMQAALGGERHTIDARDPLGRPCRAEYLVLNDGPTVVIEAAQANGIALVAPAERDPLRASTEGAGDLLLAAIAHQPERLIVGIGGSATTDAGTGMARALGGRFLDAGGRDLPPGGGALADLARLEWRRPDVFSGVDIVVASDVTNPLTGSNGAAHVFAPQKGATPAQVDQLEAGLRRFAQVARQSLGVDVDHMAGAGAAGGLGAGLVAFLGARIVSGFDVVADATRFHERLAQAAIVITGEGRFDAQSRQGKTTGRIIDAARRAGKRAVVFAGLAENGAAIEVRTLAELEPDPARSMANAAVLLEALAARWAAGAED
ncbi:MAG: glycerate kinase [Dehalococcoidia bacterium]